MNKNKYTFLKYFFLASLFLVFFVNVKHASASCNYYINRFDAGSVQTVTPDDTLTFAGQVQFTEQANNASEITDCSKNFTSLDVWTEDIKFLGSGATVLSQKGMAASTFTKSVDGKTYTYNFTKPFNLKQFGVSTFSGKNKLVFTMQVSGSLKGASAKTTWSVNLLSTGSTNPPGPATGNEKHINVTFSPTKQLYSKGDTIEVWGGMAGADVRGLPSSVSEMRMEVFINGKKNWTDFTFNKDDLLQGPRKHSGILVDAPVFTDSQQSLNDVVVNFYDTRSGVKIASGSSRIAVQGISATLNGPKVSIVGNGKSTYVIGDTITFEAQNIPDGAKVVWAVNDEDVETLPGNKISGYSISINSSDFNTQGLNDLTVLVLAADGKTELFNQSLANFGITASTTAKPSEGGAGGKGVDCKGPNPDPKYCLYNPLPTGELTTMFLWLAKGMLSIVAIWSVIFIIYGGFRMVMAAGDEEAYTMAKTTITWAILGLIVAALSFSIVAIVKNLIGSNVQGPLGF